MSDLKIVLYSLGFLAISLLVAEWRIRKLESRIAGCELEVTNANIRESVHAKSDADLDAKLDSYDGRGKPSA